MTSEGGEFDTTMASSLTSTSSGITLTSPLYSNPVTVASGVYISGPNAGIYADANYTWSISSAGTIAGTLSAGVSLGFGGEVNNGPSGATTAAITGTTGIFIAGTVGAVTNYGTITGTAGSGVYLGEGGVVTNGTSGLISGSNTGGSGIDITGAAGAVVNQGEINGTYYGIRVAYTSDASSFTNSGTITGGAGNYTNFQLGAGIYVVGVGTLVNYGSIIDIGGYSAGVHFEGGGFVSNAASGTIVGYDVGVTLCTTPDTLINSGSISALGNGSTAVILDSGGTVTNYGAITDSGSYGNGVVLVAGGYVTNAAGAVIIADGAGIGGVFGYTTVSNYGTVTGTGLSSDAIRLSYGGSVANIGTAASLVAVRDGVYFGYFGTGTVTNEGSISATGASGDGVLLGAGGTVFNQGAASHIYGGFAGVGASALAAATVFNYGTITTPGNFGVYLNDGGAVTNGATGSALPALIYGNGFGVYVDGAAGTIINYGTIANNGAAGGSSTPGIQLGDGGILINAAGGIIVGNFYGVLAEGTGADNLTIFNAGSISGLTFGVNVIGSLPSATLTNAGTISVPLGSGPAVELGAASNLLVFDPGAVFDGAVYASGGGSNVLELASASGSGVLSGLGTGSGAAFEGFNTITVDSGAQWTITGQNTVAAGTGVAVESGASLDVTGTISGGAAFALHNGSLELANAADPGDSFDFADSGGPDTLTLDAVAGASFANPVIGFSIGDKIVLPNESFIAGSTPTILGNTVTVATTGGDFVFNDFTFEAGTPQSLTVGSDFIQNAVCFAGGTRILTPAGEVDVEALRPGDAVLTLVDGKHVEQTVRWIGRRRIDLLRHPKPKTARPIRIRRHAFAEGQPHRDLLLSPEHCVAVDGMFIPIKRLVNRATILADQDFRSVDYFHIELERHAVLLAEGLAAESYLDTGNRSWFDGGDTVALHPEFSVDATPRRWATDACLPLAAGDEVIEPIWQRLAERAATLGFTVPETTRDARLRLVLDDGREIWPTAVKDGRHNFVLLPASDTVRLVSRAAAPSAVRPSCGDQRVLGVAVGLVVLHTRSGRYDFAADHISLIQGWWDVERNGAALWRWTNGDARLRLPTLADAGVACVEVHVVNTMHYPIETGSVGRVLPAA